MAAGVPAPRGATGSSRPRSPVPLVEAIVRVGASLDLDVIALGVADARCRDLIDHAGCLLAQGAAFGGPMPAEHIDALLSAQSPPRRPAWPPMLAGADGVGAVDDPR